MEARQRTPLPPRRKPIRRRAWLRRGPSRASKRLTAADLSIRRWARMQPCCARHLGPCGGPMDPHHAGRKPGRGMKAAEDTIIPLCRYHHDSLEALWGPFRGWSGKEAREWQDRRIDETRRAYAAHHGGDHAAP